MGIHKNFQIVAEEIQELFPGDYANLISTEAPAGGVLVGIAEILPESAEYVLATKNSKNRPITQTVVDRYRESIKNGEWEFNGEPIIFSADGDLRDGQHRLKAVAEEGTPIFSLVVSGTAFSTFVTIDQGARRTTGQVMTMSGTANAAVVSGATCLLRNFFTTGVICRAQSHKTTIHSNLYWASKFSAIQDSIPVARKKEAAVFNSPSLVTALHYLFSQTHPKEANEFFEAIFNKSIPVERKWSGTKSLMDRLWVANKSNRPLKLKEIAALTVKAWAGLIENRQVKLVKMYSEEEFPRLPGWVYVGNKPVEPQAEQE